MRDSVVDRGLEHDINYLGYLGHWNNPGICLHIVIITKLKRKHNLEDNAKSVFFLSLF